jgi:ribosomal protein L2
MKNIIQEGLDDSEELDTRDTTNESSNNKQEISLKPGDILRISDISEGEIVLAIESKPSKKTKKDTSEENSEGSYMWRE